MAFEKVRNIAKLLDGKGCILVRNDEVNTWFIHCWWENVSRETLEEKRSADIYCKYVADVEFENSLDEIIKKLGGK